MKRKIEKTRNKNRKAVKQELNTW